MKKLQLDSSEIRFHAEVERIVAGGADYVDAVVEWCDRNGVELEYAALWVKSNSALKSKLLGAAETLNFIKKKAAK